MKKFTIFAGAVVCCIIAGSRAQAGTALSQLPGYSVQSVKVPVPKSPEAHTEDKASLRVLTCEANGSIVQWAGGYEADKILFTAYVVSETELDYAEVNAPFDIYWGEKIGTWNANPNYQPTSEHRKGMYKFPAKDTYSVYLPKGYTKMSGEFYGELEGRNDQGGTYSKMVCHLLIKDAPDSYARSRGTDAQNLKQVKTDLTRLLTVNLPDNVVRVESLKVSRFEPNGCKYYFEAKTIETGLVLSRRYTVKGIYDPDSAKKVELVEKTFEGAVN